MDILSQSLPDNNPTREKRCSGICGKMLPATLDFFYRLKGGIYDLHPQCKTCQKQHKKDVYHSNPEVRQQALDYNKKPEVREYQRIYLKEYNKLPSSRDRNRAVKHRYRAREKAVQGTHTAQQIQDLLKWQKYKCYYCSCKFEKKNGRYVYQVEHTFPISRVVGTDIPANDISYLVLACYPCNRDKGDKFPWEFFQGGRLL